MRIISIFKLPRHRQFDYQPLYYDPKREERERRNRYIKEELGIQNKEEDHYVPGIKRGSMRHYIKSQKRASRNSNIRLIVIMSILFFLAYLLLYK